MAAVRGYRGDDVHVHVPVGDVAEGNDLSSRVRAGDHGRSGGALTLLGSTQVRGTSVGAVDARLSPDGRFLYLDESAVGKVGAFAVNDGNLTELATSPFQLPAGAAPAGIVVT